MLVRVVADAFDVVPQHPAEVRRPGHERCDVAGDCRADDVASCLVLAAGRRAHVERSGRVPDAGLFRVVPKGWLFQVIAASVQVALDLKMSIVRQAGTALKVVTQRREPDRRGQRDGRTALGESNRRYSRWFAPTALETLFVVDVPKLVVGVACRTPASMTAMVEVGVPVIVHAIRRDRLRGHGETGSRSGMRRHRAAQDEQDHRSDRKSPDERHGPIRTRSVRSSRRCGGRPGDGDRR